MSVFTFILCLPSGKALKGRCMCVIHQKMDAFCCVMFTCDTLVINLFVCVGVLVIVLVLLCGMLAC